jgi:hypothetical protein
VEKRSQRSRILQNCLFFINIAMKILLVIIFIIVVYLAITLHHNHISGGNELRKSKDKIIMTILKERGKYDKGSVINNFEILLNQPGFNIGKSELLNHLDDTNVRMIFLKNKPKRQTIGYAAYDITGKMKPVSWIMRKYKDTYEANAFLKIFKKLVDKIGGQEDKKIKDRTIIELLKEKGKYDPGVHLNNMEILLDTPGFNISKSKLLEDMKNPNMNIYTMFNEDKDMYIGYMAIDMTGKAKPTIWIMKKYEDTNKAVEFIEAMLFGGFK